MSSSGDRRASRYDGIDAVALATQLGVPRLELFEQVGSTLDVAHAIAPESPSGTLVLADEQTSGRGRQGRRWTSLPGAGIWLTLVERPHDVGLLDTLALRCGLHAARALDALSNVPIRVKWPNDLYVGDDKLAGILIETRWRGDSAEWVAIGFGLNVLHPGIPGACGLREGTSRIEALVALIPALRAACAAESPFDVGELHARAYGLSRHVTAPGEGVLEGFSASGELLIRGAQGNVTAHRSGSLVFAPRT